jgi:LPXTG-motif cell wall-anchored protein
MRDQLARGNYFDRARGVAVAILIAAAVAAIIGSLLEWVTITPPPTEAGRRQASEPFTGIEAGDGWYVIAAAVVLGLAAVGLYLRRRVLYAGIAFVAAIVIGAIAFADYRGIGEITSAISERMNVVGDADPAAGIMLVAAGAFAGLVGAVIGIVATPRTRESETY